MAIRLLDANTISKISAGEVVERPSSVVKELMENSIDAGARAITVEIKDGGISYLRVTDNGCGIPFREARLAFQNHATSKLKDADGLWDIRTLGFRGEALPSIAAVSRVTMTTREKDADFGAKVEMEGGECKGVSETGCPEGTTIVMKDLFFNLPVRQKFLKKPAYEQGLVTDVVSKIALGNPLVAVRYISNGKIVFSSLGNGDVRAAALSVYGREYAQALREVDAFEGAFKLKGLIGIGDQAKPTRSQQSFFINGRLIRCPLLSLALEDACKGRVTVGMHPTCVLSVTAPPEAVDINVHPSKLEVRFRDEAAFRLTAQSLLSKAFIQETMIGAFTVPKEPEKKENIVKSVLLPAKAEENAPAPKPEKQAVKDVEAPAPRPVFAPKNTENELRNLFKTPEAKINEVRETPFARPMQRPVPPPSIISNTPEIKPERVIAPIDAKGAEQTHFENKHLEKQEHTFRLIGVLFRTYILIESNGALIMIDQHAAHERINFENLKKRLDEGTGAQQLLIPYVVHLSRREAQIVLDSKALLEETGYQVEPFGETDIQVRAVPFILGQADMRIMFTEIIESLDMLKTAEKEKRMHTIIQSSCKHAVKAGDTLTEGEIKSLLEAMRVSGAPPTCPHGRPVLRVLTKNEIEKMFKRIQ
ncbi:MAG: DNA mismatch repair endonuclease MutL [Clostridia bacterium]|nr:DNA mismatch repair endonuclease MutL [Clostridia bacterium]